jgi:hypothetical protein
MSRLRRQHRDRTRLHDPGRDHGSFGEWLCNAANNHSRFGENGKVADPQIDDRASMNCGRKEESKGQSLQEENSTKKRTKKQLGSEKMMKKKKRLEVTEKTKMLAAWEKKRKQQWLLRADP